MNKKVLCAAIGAVVFTAPYTTMAAGMGNLFTSADGRMAVGVHYDYSNRDMEQDGVAWIFSESMTEQVSPTETLTESEKLGIGDLKAEEEQQHLYAQISFAVTPKIEVYGKAGAARTKLKDIDDRYTEHFSATETITDSEYDLTVTESFSFSEAATELDANSGHGDWGLLFGVGARFSLYQWADSGWNLGFDVGYQWKSADADWYLGGDVDSGSQMEEITSQEWFAGLRLERRMGQFRPYGGVKYAQAVSEYDGVTHGGPPGESKWTLEMENENNWGVFAGFGYSLNETTSLSVEVRALDETAANLGVNWHF